MSKSKSGKCLKCERTKRLFSKGLCRPCYDRFGHLYPKRTHLYTGRPGGDTDQMTLDELEAFIEQRRPTMPERLPGEE